MTASAKNLALDDCLRLVLNEHGFTFKKMNNIYLIGKKGNKNLISSRLVKLNHLKADGLLDMLPSKFQDHSEFKVIKEHNAILIDGVQDQIQEIVEVIKDLDKPIPQIFIEALVVDYNYQDIREITMEAGLSGSRLLMFI